MARRGAGGGRGRGAKGSVGAPREVCHVHAEGGRESRITEQGKPSQTRLAALL